MQFGNQARVGCLPVVSFRFHPALQEDSPVGLFTLSPNLGIEDFRKSEGTLNPGKGNIAEYEVERCTRPFRTFVKRRAMGRACAVGVAASRAISLLLGGAPSSTALQGCGQKDHAQCQSNKDGEGIGRHL